MDRKINNSQQFLFQKIYSRLEMHSAESTELGLYNGLMGDTISYFILFKLTGISKYKALGKEMLSKVQKSIIDVSEFGFAEGLAGIGWGIEWIKQNNFIQINTDVVLGDIDDCMYQSVIYTRDDCRTLEKGAIGRAMYFLYRLNSINPKSPRYRMICNLECLTLLSDEISEQVLSSKSEMGNKINSNSDSFLFELAESLQLMILISDNRINIQTTFFTIKTIIEIFEKIIVEDDHISSSSQKSYALLYLIHVYKATQRFLKKELFSDYSTRVQGIIQNKNIYIKNDVTDLVRRRIQIRNNVFNSHLLTSLYDLNSIQNTEYGYEAFLLK